MRSISTCVSSATSGSGHVLLHFGEGLFLHRGIDRHGVVERPMNGSQQITLPVVIADFPAAGAEP